MLPTVSAHPAPGRRSEAPTTSSNREFQSGRSTRGLLQKPVRREAPSSVSGAAARTDAEVGGPAEGPRPRQAPKPSASAPTANGSRNSGSQSPSAHQDGRATSHSLISQTCRVLLRANQTPAPSSPAAEKNTWFEASRLQRPTNGAAVAASDHRMSAPGMADQAARALPMTEFSRSAAPRVASHSGWSSARHSSSSPGPQTSGAQRTASAEVTTESAAPRS